MASQRVTIAKVGGIATNVLGQRLRRWAAAREAMEPDEWTSAQWPPSVRAEVDSFADQLRVRGCSLPVVHFVEWSDLWSMGDLFSRWLTPPGGSPLRIAFGNRFEVYGYALPDGRRLQRALTVGPQQFPEYDQFVARLREAVGAWEELLEQAIVIVLREVVGGLVTDEEFLASMSVVPDWISGGGSSEEAPEWLGSADD
ncbi:MAG: hypothetical protein ACYC61_01770 [Isosphaeraceae bacterium]